MQLSHQFIRTLHLDESKEIDRSKYPFNIKSLKKFEKMDFNPEVTFFIGENGAGKSTLLEALAVSIGINAEGGSHHLNFKTKATHSNMYEHLKIVRGIKRPKDNYFLRAESFYNVATAMENLEDPNNDPHLHFMSHGESFFQIAFERLRGNGLYLFDEPEAALSPTRQLSFVSRMHELCKLNSQMVIATHSPIILSYPNSTIYEFSEHGIKKVLFEETEHYQVTKNFLNNYKLMLKELMAD